MAVPQFFTGWDYGNSTSALVTFVGGKRYGSVTFPSLSAPGSLRQLEDVRTSAGLPVFGKEDYLLQLDDGQDIYWGKLAFESSDATAARGDVSRYWSTRSLEALLVASGSLIPVEEYELFVTTGLPVETYTKEHRRLVRDALSGDYPFFLNGRPKRVRIHVTQVIMEGAGALIAYGDKDDKKQGAIDIGGRTTDLFATQGQVPRMDFCKGKPLGVEKVGELLQRMIQESLAEHTLEPEELYRVLHASAGDGEYPTLYAHGSRIPTHLLMDWVGKTREIVAKDIVSFVSATWSSGERGIVASNFGKTILVGGGAYYFAREMQSRIPNLYIPTAPELANALGYGALAVSLGPQAAIPRIA